MSEHWSDHIGREQVPVKVLVELEDEAAELLAWSDNLDYDAYVSTWTSLATVGINVAETVDRTHGEAAQHLYLIRSLYSGQPPTSEDNP